MKQFFTCIFLFCVTIVAHAADYNVPIKIIVDGAISEQTAVVTVTETDGKCSLTLKNFMLITADSPMPVGNVELTDLQPTKDGDVTLLMASQIVTVTNGDPAVSPFWLATMLPPVPVNLCAKIIGDKLNGYIDINIGQSIQVAIGDGYGLQLSNRGFEEWHTSTGSYVEPNGWHSFESGTGDMVALAGHHLSKSDDAHSGTASACLLSTKIFGIVANGTMTTGRMNAASAFASDVSNHAYLDMSETYVDGNGDPFYTPLYSRPDSIAFWVKFKQGTPNASHPYATVSAVITDGTYYQDPEDKTYTNVVAKAKNNTIATTGDQWVRVVAPFEYTDNSVSPKAILVTLSTNADAGCGSDGDELLVDDAELIYNVGLKALKIKGQAVPEFDKDKTEYTMALDQSFTADDIEAETVSPSVVVLKDVKQMEGGYQCVLTAFSGDLSKAVVYTVTVSVSTGIQTVSPAASQQSAFYSLDGRRVLQPRSGQIYLHRQADGKVVKVLR